MAKSKTNKKQRKWTAVGFLNEFMRIHETMDDRSFAFILGAGASVTSGIPAGGTLARSWIEELHELHVENIKTNPIENWATEENLEIEGFQLERAATFYPQIYDRRFGDDPESGYAYLEDKMKDAEPNIGYSILAQVLAETRHKVVITTNFDNLVANALAIYTNTFPIVCGHESLAGFARPKLRRPLVAKIHRDLLLAPKNNPSATASLDERWADVLRRLLKEYTPIVIGYGGNDGSLMDFLAGLKPGEITGGLFWCYRRTDQDIDERIKDLVEKQRGQLIPIVGFDEFMIQLSEHFGYKLLDDQIENQAKERVKRYREQFEKFQRNLAKPLEDAEAEEAIKPVRKALTSTVDREKSWWSWELKAREEKDPEKRKQIYLQGLEQFPDSSNLIGSFAVFMADVKKDHDEAERLFRQALKLNPDNAINTGNFANFMHDVKKDDDEAERLYRHLLELAPDSANATGNFAYLMHYVRKDYAEAERLFRRALELDPDNANTTGNFANFMKDVRKDYAEAERLYRRALELDPDDAIPTGNFANFMQVVREDYAEAERLFRRALKLDPDNANTNGNFAIFMQEVQKDYDEAERLYRRALELDPDHENATGNFASFMQVVRKDYAEAERLYRRALELDPDNANTTGNFAGFQLSRNNIEEAKEYLLQAWILNKGEIHHRAAEFAFYWCLIRRMKELDDTFGLSRIKFLFEENYLRLPWSFESVLETAKQKLSKEEMNFYTALADAILDQDKVGELNQFERWKEIESIPIDEPWEMWD